MALRKSPFPTAAMLAANPANAQKCTGPSAQGKARCANAKRSTGPRTQAGKARVRLNPLKRGNRCLSYERFVRALLGGSERVDRLAATRLRPYEVDHPLFATLIESCLSTVGPHAVRWVPGRDPE